MQRKIVDFTKVPLPLKKRLKDEFPDGFEDADVVRFQNAKGEEVKAIRMEDEEAEIVYLIKFERKLDTINDEFMEDDYDEPDTDFDLEDEEDDDDLNEE